NEQATKPIHAPRNEILDSFHIKINTIIRTQDSRNLGAKYLNETELRTNDECIQWCWQTVPCNLAVFEEKNQGSCYLFDCGPKEDFRCKFTSHNFYTSSVLKTSRFIPDQNQFSKHENDLVKLRSSPTSSPRILVTGNIQKNSTASTTRSLIPPPTHPSVSVRPTPQSRSVCQHYQFRCRNSTECIAIYNVCDGIPQCPDGSDEAADLHCPESNYGTQSVANSQSKVDKSDVKPVTDNKQARVDVSNQLGPNAFQYPNGPDATEDNKIVKQQSSFGHKYSNFVPGSQQYNRNYFNNQYQNLWNQYYPQSNDGYTATNNRGFSSENDYNAYGREVQNAPFWGSDNQRNNYDFAIGNSPQALNNNYGPLPKHQSTQIPWSQNYNYYNYQTKTDDTDTNFQKAYIASLRSSNQQENNSTQKTVDHAEVKDQKTVSNTDAKTTSKISEYSNINKHVNHVANGPIIAVSRIHESHTVKNRDTNSAVIALILGLCVTAMLVAIVGCRMKSIRRRIARRGRNLAHDADYLVNGMYL
ncbi:hypothetical protein B4U80_09856, partial [Leptotrombidium deliense]